MKNEQQARASQNKKLSKVSTLALSYSQTRAQVLKTMGGLSARFAKLRDPVALKVGPQIKRAEKLRDQIMALLPPLESLFVEPKSKTLHGVKLGFRKAGDSLRVADPASTILRVREAYPDSKYVIEKPTLDLEALEKLTTDELAALGIARETGKNEPFCSVSDGLEKQAKTLGLDVAKEVGGAS